MNKNVFSNSVEKVNTIENLYKYIFVLKICSVYFLRAVLYEYILVLHEDSGFIFELSLQKEVFLTFLPIPHRSLIESCKCGKQEEEEEKKFFWEKSPSHVKKSLL